MSDLYIGKSGNNIRSGYTTVSTAAAAAKAALIMLLEGGVVNNVTIQTPKGHLFVAEVTDIHKDADARTVSCAVAKDLGDDTDVTDGLKIFATASLIDDNTGEETSNGIIIRAGEGIGTVTGEGLPIPAGSPAIYPISMEKIRKCLEEVLSHNMIIAKKVVVEISAPDAANIADRSYDLRQGIEGGIEILDAIKAIIAAKIPVMGHLGLTPQSINVFGGFKVQGKDLDSAKNLIRDALALQDAGVFAFTFEGIPAKLMTFIQSKLTVPTIGIGAGADSDGQVLVINDIIGMCDNMRPKFVKQYADVGSIILDAVNSYCSEVKDKTFPAAEHTFKISDEVIEALKNE